MITFTTRVVHSVVVVVVEAQGWLLLLVLVVLVAAAACSHRLGLAAHLAPPAL